MDKQKLIILSGPTAVGKTAISIGLAHILNGEIISADSMQVYKHMDIGSGKIKPLEMEGVPHHLIDCLDPREDFNVKLFKAMAEDAMKGIVNRGRLPIVVGGTGFYIQAIAYDIAFSEEADDLAFRKELETEGKEKGKEYLHNRLKELDPKAAEMIPAGNMKRVIRALEFFHSTGKPISEHNAKERAKPSPYDLRYFVLTLPRDELYRDIENRVDGMVAEGLFEEVEKLREMGVKAGMTSMQGLGYKQAYKYFDGVYNREEAIEAIKKETRHFAKRQLTWFKREKEAVWVDKGKFNGREELISYIAERCR